MEILLSNKLIIDSLDMVGSVLCCSGISEKNPAFPSKYNSDALFQLTD